MNPMTPQFSSSVSAGRMSNASFEPAAPNPTGKDGASAVPVVGAPAKPQEAV